MSAALTSSEARLAHLSFKRALALALEGRYEDAKISAHAVLRLHQQSGEECLAIVDGLCDGAPLRHRGFSGSAAYCPYSRVYHGHLLHISDLVTYEAADRETLPKAMREAVEDYVFG